MFLYTSSSVHLTPLCRRCFPTFLYHFDDPLERGATRKRPDRRNDGAVGGFCRQNSRSRIFLLLFFTQESFVHFGDRNERGRRIVRAGATAMASSRGTSPFRLHGLATDRRPVKGFFCPFINDQRIFDCVPNNNGGACEVIGTHEGTYAQQVGR